MRWWVNLLFLFICSFSYASAGNVTLNYPSFVNCSQEFNVDLTLINFSGVYDVKIDILNNGTRISQIFNNGSWQSTYNYALAAVNTSLSNSSSFRMNISEFYNSSADIEVKLRKGSSIYSFSGFSINVLCQNTSNQTNNTTNNQTENNTTINSTTNQTTSNTSTTNTKTSFIIDAAKNITYDDELDVGITPVNFVSGKSYELKIFILFQDDTISEIYNGGWKSGVYYVPYSDSNRIRIKSSYSDIYGTGDLVVRLRESGKSDYIESSQTIEILKYSPPKENTGDNYSVDDIGNSVVENYVVENKNAEGVIVLNSNVVAPEEKVIYESKNEKIRQYSVYAFCLFLIFLIAVILLKR